ncbi:hypothetical protein DL765_010941 [Monosporascus sp. GIB2]|nr:hypothetical protein DL765_010941 [Monosporascus sp. GIB2]
MNVFFKEASKFPKFSWPKSIEDTRVSIELSSHEQHEIGPQDFESAAAMRFVLDCFSAACHERGSVARLVSPRSPSRIENLQTFLNAFKSSAGGMLLAPVDQTGHKSVEAQSASLDAELSQRLSFPWLSTQAPRRQTLAIVDGGISSPEHGGTRESVYSAAAALGIDMVVLDSAKHWVNSPKYAHWRKATVPLECPLEPDSEFASRIADAVRSYEGQIDGIVTFRDHYKLPVAEAAVKLSLPTYPPSAYDIATDKFKTSVLEGHHAVENLPQLEAGVKGINNERHGSEFVIEKYCEGPEVDANLVVFFEVSDDFPKSADVNGHGNVESFIELANVPPSKLPENELAVLQNSLHQSLLRMGFRDVFYHLEARVENSSMEYVTKDGILDLTERSVSAKAAPTAWLIEINPRPPGIQASDAVKHTYGIDYFGVALLFALEDKHRVKQLSHPFAQGPQYWCEMVSIPGEKGGVYESGDLCAELFERRPDLAACVSGSFCFLRKGDRATDPSTSVNSWVAYFNVFSRESREHLLKVADTIRQEVTFSII